MTLNRKPQLWISLQGWGYCWSIRVLDIRPAAAMKVGGTGDRYTIRVNGKQSYLFFERNASIKGDNIGRWFVERKANLTKLF